MSATVHPLPAAAPYEDSRAHLWDELRRVDQLVRAQTACWRVTLAGSKPEKLWGMVHVSDAEVEAYLDAPYLPPDAVVEELAAVAAPYRRTAEDHAASIGRRLAETPPGLELRLVHLCRVFGLSEFERDVLLLCLLPEVDARYARLYGYLRDDASRATASVELLLRILRTVEPRAAVTGRAAFDPAAPLLAWHLLELGDGREEPLPVREARLDDRVAGYLLGDERPDARLTPALPLPGELPGGEALVCPPRQLRRFQALANWWAERRQEDDGWGAAVLLYGSAGSGRLAAAGAVCEAVGSRLLVVDVPRALGLATDWPTLVRLACREALLGRAALYWNGCETLLGDGEERGGTAWETLLSAAESFPGVSFLASARRWEPSGRFRHRPFLRLDFPMPDHRLRRQLWLAYLPPAESFAEPAPDREALAAVLANSFQLTGGQIADAAAAAPAYAFRRDPEDARLTLEDLYEGCRRQSSHHLESFARRIEPRSELGFDDLILPEANRRQLEELRGRIRHRHQVLTDLGFGSRMGLGHGLVALFTGPSGTGKTMAAELLAREQGVDLYKIELSNVVSKYVGETEKNLNQIFLRAEDANAVLFFDEADALFGKRGEVQEARDRWANLEVNYLLQRIEEYSGVVILTSNLRQNMDAAFVRRIQVIVEFPHPDGARREAIWRGLFPPGVARASDEELRLLAERFPLSGGDIKNVVLHAAFRALADADGEAPCISLRHLVQATVREYQKAGKPVTRSEFGEDLFPLTQG